MTERSDAYMLVDKRGQYVGDYLGVKMFFLNSSYSCPEFDLFGYRNDYELKKAIKRVDSRGRND